MHIESIGQLAEKLKLNKTLNDSTVVYYLPVPEGQDVQKTIKEFDSQSMIALNFMRGETEQVLVVTDQKVAEKCRLQPNIYYAYFKPSYLNGYESLVGKDLNLEYLQAYEGICRDEFTVNTDFISSDEFMSQISKNRMIFTEQLVRDNFDLAFDRTTKTEFIMNPSFEARYLSPHADRPQCFVYVPDQYMSKYIFEIKDAIRDYADTFEFVFT